MLFYHPASQERKIKPNRSPTQEQSLSAGGRGQCLHTHSNYERKRVKFIPDVDVPPAVLFGERVVAHWVLVRWETDLCQLGCV